MASDLVFDQECLFVAAENGFVYKLAKEDGRVVKQAKVRHLMGRGHQLVNTLYYISGFDNSLYAVNKEDLRIAKYGDQAAKALANVCCLSQEIKVFLADDQ